MFNFPHLWTCLSVGLVLRIGAEVVNVDSGQSGDKQLEFLLVEHRNEVLRDDLVEALQERVQLLADRTCKSELPFLKINFSKKTS